MKRTQVKKWLACLTAAALLGTAGCGSITDTAENVETESAAETSPDEEETAAGSSAEGSEAGEDPEQEEKNAVKDKLPEEESAGEPEEEAADEDGSEEEEESASGTAYTPATIASIDTLDLTDMFSEKDLDDTWDTSEAASVVLNGTSVEISGDGVTAEGTRVTITEAGTYILSGNLDDGQILVEASEDDKVQLVLNGVSMTNDDSACIFVKSADKVILTLAEGTENAFSDTGSAFVQPDDGSTVDAVIFSREDLSLNGSGALTVTAGTEHGIVCKDDLVITGGTYTITAAGKGLVGEDSLRVKDGNFTITAEDDAVHTSTNDKEGKGYIYIENGSFTLSSGDDGIHAATALIVAGGDITVTESYEGLEGATIDILDGNINITARDDALNAAYSTSDSDAEIEWDNGGPGRMSEGGNFPENGSGWGGMAQNNDISDEEWEEMMQNSSISDEEWEEIQEYWTENGEGGDMARPGSGELPEDMTPPDMDREGMTPPDMGGEEMTAPETDGEENMTPPETDGEDMEGGMTPREQGGGRKGGKRPDGGSAGDMGGAQNGAGGFGMMDVQEDSYLRISGGTIYANAGGDGLDANGYIYVEGGSIQVDGPTDSGNGAIDYGLGAEVSGGTVAAAGSAGMAESFGSGSSQYSLSYTFSETVSGGTALILTDADGKEILQVTPAKDYQNIVISTPDLQAGTYTVSAGEQTETITISNIAEKAGAAAGTGFSKPENREEERTQG